MEFYDDQWKYFVEIGAWPKRSYFAPQDWITNFTEEEKPFAKRLLEKFTFFSDEMVKQLFKSSFLSISKDIILNKYSLSDAQVEWGNFLKNVYILKITGEDPSDADSGYLFSRWSRDLLGVPEDRLIQPAKAYELIRAGIPANFIFVDDFVGSGQQFVNFWFNENFVENNSFALLTNSESSCKFFYCPTICTDLGKKFINQYCPKVSLRPAHFYGDIHCALNPDSYIWRKFDNGGPDFIRSASLRAGIPDSNGSVTVKPDGDKIVSWEGYQKLGLCLSFGHGWPDATLPIFYFNQNGWKPLLKKDSL